MNTTDQIHLNVENLDYSIDGEKILNGINFNLYPGKVSCLLGPSGCGKTTLLKLIAGLLSPDHGRIVLGDQNIARINGNLRLDKHPAMMVFQDLGLFPHMKVSENVAYGLNLKANERKHKVEQILTQLDLKGYSSRYPHELSGGQQQRIALARALVLEPQILLLDEPFANLDTALRQPLAEEVLQLLRERGIITLLVTHDREDALSLGDYVGVMGDGEILQWDTPQNLLSHPALPQVARFTGHNSVIKGKLLSSGSVETVLGSIQARNELQVTVENMPVEVLLRCSDAQITQKNTTHAAKVIYRSLEAEQLIYALKLENNEQIFALAAQQLDLQVGESTHVELVNTFATVYNH